MNYKLGVLVVSLALPTVASAQFGGKSYDTDSAALFAIDGGDRAAGITIGFEAPFLVGPISP